MSSEGTGERRLRNYLIDKRFQLRYTLYLIGVTLLIFVVLGVLYFEESRLTSHLTENILTFEELIEAPEGGADPFAEELHDSLLEEDLMSLPVMIGVVALLVVLLLFLGIYFTHRMAGPVFAMAKLMRGLTEGKIGIVRPLRARDEFKNLHEEFTGMCEFLKDKELSEIAILESIAATLEGEHRAKVEELVATKHAFLGE